MSNFDNFNIKTILKCAPYDIAQRDKKLLYAQGLSALSYHHWKCCPQYQRVTRVLFKYNPVNLHQAEDIPYIPVRLFKDLSLRSVGSDDVIKTMTSSGTGGSVSKIFLDRENASNQTKAIVRIVSSFTGNQRMPFLIVDSPSVLKDRTLFSARGAGILGFSMFGFDNTYLLKENYDIDFENLNIFLDKHKGKRVLLFGFTFVVWKYLCRALQQIGRKLEIDGMLIHGGGWKRLSSLAISNDEFRDGVFESTGISAVHNYYGMVEQTGSIFMECEKGVLHASIFSDLIIRNPSTLQPLDMGQVGLVQLLSLLPTSYPGHSILSEDLGEILGVDDCPCGRKGKYFRIHGRVENAEVRGCSDAYTTQ